MTIHDPGIYKALIAAGPRGLGAVRISDWLWPDAEGDAGLQALETSLHRLRQVLGVEGAVVMRDGHLSLDPYRCWVDAHAFEWLLDRLAPNQGEEGTSRALALYAGPFLEDLGDPWIKRYRDHLKERFLKAILAQASHCEAQKDRAAAIAWYEQGLRAEPASEGLYRRLILCHQANGAPAEALRAHERCRNALRALLGVDPSAETERLVADLRG